MTVTLQVNYKEHLAAATVEFIEGLLEDNYELSDILEFVDEHCEEDLVAYYEKYVEAGENIGYDVVDAFINYHSDVSYVEYVEDAYRGSYNSEEEFAEEFTEGLYGEVPSYLIVDWAATWNCNLRYDFDYVNGFVFSSQF